MDVNQMRVGIFLFNDVEVLDFAGPFEVFSVTTNEDGSKPFIVRTISETGHDSCEKWFKSLSGLQLPFNATV